METCCSTNCRPFRRESRVTGQGLRGRSEGFSDITFTEGDVILKPGPAPPINRHFLRTYRVPGIVLGTEGNEQK